MDIVSFTLTSDSVAAMTSGLQFSYKSAPTVLSVLSGKEQAMYSNFTTEYSDIVIVAEDVSSDHGLLTQLISDEAVSALQRSSINQRSADACSTSLGFGIPLCPRLDNQRVVEFTISAVLMNSTLFGNTSFLSGLVQAPPRLTTGRQSLTSCNPFCTLPMAPSRKVNKGDRVNSDRETCSVDGSSCLSSGLNTLGKLAIMQSANTELLELPRLFIESVEPNLLNPSDGTWLRIAGLGFTNRTRCLVNNVTATPVADYLNAFSTVSSTLMYCYVQKMTALRTPYVTITLYDTHAGRASVNSAELYFLDRLSFQSKGKVTKKSPSPAGVPTSMMLSGALASIIGTDICVSSSCVALIKAPACGDVDPAWSDYLLSSDSLLGGSVQVTGLSLCSGRAASNYSERVSASFNTSRVSNTSIVMLESIITTYESIISSEDFTGTVMISLPAQESSNNTAASVYFYGTAFNTHDRWCARFNRILSECLVQSSTAIQCPIDTTNVAPGIRTVELLHLCLISAANHSVSILPVSNLADPKPVSFIGSLSAPSAIDWGEVPRVIGIKPSSGPMSGYTRITVYGTSMHDVDACRFNMVESNESVTVPALFNFVESAVFCNTTTMPIEGLASVELSYNSLAWISTDQVFKFYRDPMIYQTTAQFDEDGNIPIYGEMFPESQQAYCKVGLSSGVVLLVSAEVVSSRLLLCRRLPYRFVHSGMVSSLQLSFNGENFVAVSLAVVSSVSKSNETATDLSFSWRKMNQSELPPSMLMANISADLLQSISLPSAFDLFCDGTSSLPVPLGFSQATNYSCIFDSTVRTRGLRVASDSVICPIPSRRPGMYTLVVEREFALQQSPDLPQVVQIKCTTRPTILSVQVIPVATSGANVFLITGFNFAASSDIFCTLDEGLQYATGTVSESTHVACSFPPLVPGIHLFRVMVSRSTVLFEMRICLSEILLVSGGSLTRSDNCDLSTLTSGIFPAPPMSAKTYDFSSWWPQIGSTGSSTDVEIIAANIEYGQAYTCVFGEVMVPANVVSTGKIFCASPSHQQAGNVTLVVNASSGDSWVGAWFIFVSEIKVTSAFPAVLSYDGGDVLVLKTAFLPPKQLDLFCHIGSQIAPAFREGVDTLSCVSPILSTSAVQVAIGSGTSILSNVVSIPVSNGQGISSIFPRHGSYRGGTMVTLAVPTSLVGFLQDPTCAFSGTRALSASLSEDKSTLTCVTPAFESGLDSSNFGVVSVEFIESSSASNSPVYNAGSYSIEMPADVGTVSPTVIMRNSSADLLVQGSFRRDTPDLTCHLETEARSEVATFAARWLSDTLVLCSLSAQVSLRLPALSRFLVRISTNGQDKSKGSATIALRSDDLRISVNPQNAFTSGSGPVIVSTNSVAGDAYHCNFGGRFQVAYKVSNSTLICVAPTHPAGTVDLVVADEATSSNSVSFTYVDLPTIKTVSPSVLLSSTETNVIISGEGFESEKNITGRFRRPDGSLVAGNCSGSGDKRVSVFSCQVRPTRGDDVVILDMTINGVDYKTNMLTLQTFSPNAAVSIKPVHLFSSGGSHIEFTVLPNRRTALALSCRFIEVGRGSDQTVAVVMASMLSDNIADCVTPPLQLGSGKTYAFMIEQSGVSIFGPLSVDISQSPHIDAVAPGTIFTGVTTPILVTFLRPCLVNLLSCELQGALYKMRYVNSTAGLCSVQPLLAGRVSLRIRSNEFTEDGIQPTFNFTVIDPPSDVTINTSAVLRGVSSAISFISPSCTFPKKSICVASKDRTVDVMTVSASSCEVLCSISSPQNADHVLASLCVALPCPKPFFSRLLRVISGVNVFSISPSSGPVQGTTTVSLIGMDFDNEASLQCAFGDAGMPSLAVFKNERELVCSTPPHAPGVVSVMLLSHGLVVSSSYAQFEYLPILANVTLSVTTVSSLGGTPLSITTARLTSTGPYLCRFGEKSTPALLLNSTILQCTSPPLDGDIADFAITINGVDLCLPQRVSIVVPPTVLFIEPLSVTSGLSGYTFTLILDASVSKTGYSCLLAGQEGELTIEGVVMKCFVSVALTQGAHTISLFAYSALFFEHSITSRSNFDIVRVSPLISISNISTAVTLTSLKEIDVTNIGAGRRCCFGELSSLAILMSAFEWQCYTPSLAAFSGDSTILPVGLSGADGVCSPIGFSIEFIAPLAVLSVQGLSGPTVGGTVVTIEFANNLPQTMYCRIGYRSSVAQVIGKGTLICVTRPEASGSYDIELSVSGQDFFSIGLSFTYMPLIPLDQSASVPPLTPIVFYVYPASVMAGRSQIVTVVGEAFQPGCLCYIGSLVALETTFLSVSEIECIVPVHVPGVEFLSVVNVGNDPSQTASSQNLALNFNFPATLNLEPTANTVPSSGPRDAYTQITVFGTNLDIAASESQGVMSPQGGGLFCLIGSDWSYAFEITATSVKCIAPPSFFSGKVDVRLAMANKEFLPGTALFEYITNPLLFELQPSSGSINTEIIILGRGFYRLPSPTCLIGSAQGVTTVLSDTEVVCVVPQLTPGTYSVTLTTNGQNVVRSGLEFRYFAQTALSSLWPYNGPSLKGNTIVTIYGQGFKGTVDVRCNFNASSVPAVVISEEMVVCRTPSHTPGLVKVSLTSEGTLLHRPEDSLDFLFALDVSVEKVTPPNGYTSGGYAIFVFGSNFLNTSSLGCAFADMKSRGIFLSSNSLICLAPSPLGRPEIRYSNAIPVEVTNNGYDYSDSGILFSYFEPCDAGFFCPGLGKSLCPNGTYCPQNSRNFTLCPPGQFQPREGQISCNLCPIGYICPDLGLSRPLVCPAGAICDVMGLRYASKSCPQGHYCLNGTKASTADEFVPDIWLQDYVTGVRSFNTSFPRPYHDAFVYKNWSLPALGFSRPQHPPIPQCDGLDCSPGGTLAVVAEAPYPCPIGYYCRTGVTSQIPIPKNYSTPQRCFDGFFCPRGSGSPEGSGPCLTGYFCPTQLDAILCPRGHYCPGVGNRAPVECYPGTFNPFEGKGNCTVCPTGHVCPGWGTLLPELCPPGYVCMSLGLSFPVVLCPQGYTCQQGTRTLDPSDPTPYRPVACPGGVFCLGGVSSTLIVSWIPEAPYGKNYAQECSEGTFCKPGSFSSAGSGLCYQGHYCPPAQSFPVETPKGTKASQFGSVAPTMCFPGTYAPLFAQVDCLACPAGHTCQSYGTYKPTICPIGTFRSAVDSVTCRFCQTGTFSYEVGSTDLTMCYACLFGRVCGISSMYSLSQAADCPPGFVCGYGTDATRQFLHKVPGGFHGLPQTNPSQQYNSFCQPGYYCERGTSTQTQFRSRCTVGYFCPMSTPTSGHAEISCPSLTTSLSGVPAVTYCTINNALVCDKIRVNPIDPFQDVSYITPFSAHSLEFQPNGQLALYNFDSSAGAAIQTGEVQVVAKVQITNETASDKYYQNDTIEAFRACPPYYTADPPGGAVLVQIIGKNFYDTRLNYCKIRACISANEGKHLRRCKNQLVNKFGEDLPKIGAYSTEAYVTKARYISPSRMECAFPAFTFEDKSSFLEEVAKYAPDGNILSDPDQVWAKSVYGPSSGNPPVLTAGNAGAAPLHYPIPSQATPGSGLLSYRCGYIYPTYSTATPPVITGYAITGYAPNSTTLGSDSTMPGAKLAYIRVCDPKATIVCSNIPSPNLEAFTNITFFCTPTEIYEGVCTNNPTPGYMMNPCITAEVSVEVTNDGQHYSGGQEMGASYGTTVLSTVQYLPDPTTGLNPVMYENFINYVVNSTFAVFTYVYPENWNGAYTSGIMEMEKKYCNRPRYSEEAPRLREEGWFRVLAHEAAHVSIDFSQLGVTDVNNIGLSQTMMYGEHYELAFSVLPSRCTVEQCTAAKIQGPPVEYTPCRKPHDLPQFFLSSTTPKNTIHNFTVYALDDVIFKVEVWITHGLFRQYAPLFKNTSTVRLVRPQRAVFFQTLNSSTKVVVATTSNAIPPFPSVRQMSQYVSFDEAYVPNLAIFCIVYTQASVSSISQALNMPPLYSAHQKGRVLIMYNTTDRPDVPFVLQGKVALDAGTAFWDQPRSTLGDSKEVLDAYFETFHNTQYTPNGFSFAFTVALLPYVPYFSNCRGYDKYIPFWMLTESHECELPQYHQKAWFRYKYAPLPDYDRLKAVGQFDMLSYPIGDTCYRTLQCAYDEDLPNQDNQNRWFEMTGGSMFTFLRFPVDYFNYTGRASTHPSWYDAGGQQAYNTYQADSVDNFIPVKVSVGGNGAGSGPLSYPRVINFTVNYMLVKNTTSNYFTKRIILSTIVLDYQDADPTNTAYTVYFNYEPLDWFSLTINFAFDVPIYILLFVLLGSLSMSINGALYFVARWTTPLANPPDIKIGSFIFLITPNVIAGVFLAMFPNWILLMFGNLILIGGPFIPYPNVANPPSNVPFNPVISNAGVTPVVRANDYLGPFFGNETNMMDLFDLTYNNMGPNGTALTVATATMTSAQVLFNRNPRIGTVFFICGICAMNCANGMFFPKPETKRQREVARQRTPLADKDDLWTPVLWKKANFMFWSITMGVFCCNMVQMSFAGIFGGQIWFFIVGMNLVFGTIISSLLPNLLQDKLLVAPIELCYAFACGLVTFGSPDFIQFVLSDMVGLLMDSLTRCFLNSYIGIAYSVGSTVFVASIKILLFFLPKYVIKNVPMLRKIDEDFKASAAKEKKREVEGVVSTGNSSESVEPILEALTEIFSDELLLYYMPFFVYLFIQFRNECGVPANYGIRQSDMKIYMFFQVVLIPFQTVADIFNIMTLEVFHGWKVYEYLVYSRYRFIQRETRWKGMEDSLDECIEEGLRQVDQMCFSSQFYMMMCMSFHGMVMIIFAVTTWLQWQYNVFADPGVWPLTAFIGGFYIILEYLMQQAAIFFELWKVKHENTNWHLLRKEEEDLDIPGWEDIKGASHEAYLMNQRITSETFRYKFLNYNRTWLINQLPQLLTPRTLRRSRPYLISQFARIINARRDDISDDSDKEDRGFGPVALSAPSRSIIRWWLGKARRRLRLKTVIEPLVRRARGTECEQCLSRKQLQIEYEIDVDDMAAKYDAMYPGDEEVDQVQWKTFWMNNQRYHTICLACLNKRKEKATRAALAGVMDTSLLDDDQEEYPDWGPVYLTAASKAILLNWYRKAQRMRQGKRGARVRKEKVVKAISDDEGEEMPANWVKNLQPISASTEAIAIKWVRTARARLLKKRGKGSSTREADLPADQVEDEAIPTQSGAFKSGKRSAMLRK